MAIQLVTFAVGALFTLALQFLSTRLGLLREKARESWIRRLNSYQDFNTAAVGLAELWRAGIVVPEAQAWEAIALARKAAYDAALYDNEHPSLTARMKELSTDLVRLASRSERNDREVLALVQAAAEVWEEFASFEPALQPASGRRWLGV